MEVSPWTALELEEASRAWLAHPRPEGGASSLWPITSGLRPPFIIQPQGRDRTNPILRVSHARWHGRPAPPV